jgi:CRISPR-associated endonuclease/helicase Cas3
MHDTKIIENFRWRYGYLEAYEYIHKNAFGIGVKEARVIQSRCSFPPQKGGLPSDKREIYFRQGLELIGEHYFIHMNRTSHEIMDFVGFLERNTDPEILDIIEELGSFRGDSLDIAYYDTISDQFGLYDAFFLLRWAEMDILPEKQFKRAIPEKYHKKIDDVSERVIGYGIIANILEKPRYVKIAGRNLTQMDFRESERKSEKAYGLLPIVSKNNPQDFLNMSTIVNKVKSRGLFCRYLPNTSRVSKNYYSIDDYTVLLNYKDGCLAIGLDAIYVDCIIYDLLSRK